MIFNAALVASLAAISSAHSLGGLLKSRDTFISSGCPAVGTPSCSSNGSTDGNTCCYESPGGLLVLTQFWDFNPSTGPSDSWTIHGLWPDNCDGTFTSNCDSSRAYTDIAGLLTDQGASDTLSTMQKYWVDINGQDEHFWEHEWATHGTCYSTLNPSCLPSGSPTGAEAVAFFQTVVGLFQKYNIYDALSNAGITPGSGATYALSDVKSAVQTAFGVTPALYCKSGSLNQVYIYFNLQGSVIDGQFNPIDAPISGSCSSTVRYQAKH